MYDGVIAMMAAEMALAKKGGAPAAAGGTVKAGPHLKDIK